MMRGKSIMIVMMWLDGANVSDLWWWPWDVHFGRPLSPISLFSLDSLWLVLRRSTNWDSLLSELGKFTDIRVTLFRLLAKGWTYPKDITCHLFQGCFGLFGHLFGGYSGLFGASTCGNDLLTSVDWKSSLSRHRSKPILWSRSFKQGCPMSYLWNLLLGVHIHKWQYWQ